MKFFLLCKMFFLCIFLSCSSECIIIYEPIGEMDKPLPKIQLSNFTNNSLDTKCFLLDNASLYSLCDFIENNIEKYEFDDLDKFEYGAFKIVVIQKGNKKEYILSTHDKSLKFFKNQNVFFKENPEISKEFTYLKKRIDY